MMVNSASEGSGSSKMSLSPQLSPWDISGFTFDFDLYRPRRNSYLFATRTRRRTSSYRSATSREDSNSDVEQPKGDFIEGIVHKKRKESYKRANRHDEPDDDGEEENADLADGEAAKPPAKRPRRQRRSYQKRTYDLNKSPLGPQTSSSITIALNDKPIESITTTVTMVTPVYGAGNNMAAESEGSFTPESSVSASKWVYRKNMFVLCLSFILVFTVFRSIQNLQSSLNKENKLGVISMCCVYSSMFLSCLVVPILINRLSAKWSIVIGLIFYHFWIAANFYPHFYTLIPTSVTVGLGQSMAWTGQVSYLAKLASDYTFASKEVSEYDIYKFNGIFLACFQTTHIWGNLVSSLMLHVVRPNVSHVHENGLSHGANLTWEEKAYHEAMDSKIVGYIIPDDQLCGVFDDCLTTGTDIREGFTRDFRLAPNSVIKLMGAHLVLAFAGFLLILLFLDKINTKMDSAKSLRELMSHNLCQMFRDKTFRLLIPLLIFNGFEQGFLYSDFNKSFVTCPVGIEYIGYTMITLGAANVISSMFVGVLVKRMPREVIIGIAGIMHIGLAVFLLIWIPTKDLMPLIFISAAFWGVADSVWQTQCNVLISLSCPEDHDVAFTNFRLLQAFGAALAFGLGTCLCMATKMYILISLLVCAMMFYAMAEYRIKHTPMERHEVRLNSADIT